MASDGTPWVARMVAWNIWANPRLLEDSPLVTAKKISPLLYEEKETEDGTDPQELEKERISALLAKDVSWVSLKLRISDEAKKNIEAMEIAGINFDQVEASFYPEASAAAHILGFVGKDNNGEDI